MFARHETPASRLIVGVALCLLALYASASFTHAFASSGTGANASADPNSSQVQAEALSRALGRPLSNRITEENALPGTDEWASIGNYDINALSAFPGATSVNAGSPINIHVSSSGGSLSARLYRLGYYQNHGARLYTTYSGISTPAQPACTRQSSTGLVQCPWSPTFTINTDPSWISGIYLLRLDSNNGFRTFVYFTIRNDSYPADILVMEPTKTNQAYNRYGGESLYYSGNNEGRTRAYKVSFDRPYNSGAGTGTLFTHDIEMVRWLEASGYDVSYISDVDRASNPDILLGHKIYMDEGHDEYWTWGERDAVEAAVAAGVNVIFASGNESFWNVRLEDSAIGPNRIITCYKDASVDPTQTPPGLTVTFRDLGRPENMLVGTGYQSYQDDALYNGPWTVSAPAGSWYFDCTGLQPGVVVNNIVGEEWNAFLGSGGTPPGIEALSNGMVVGNNGLQYPQNSAMYTAPSGAMVFSAGSIHWSWGLIDHSYANQVFQSYAISNDADQRIEQLMANIIDRFAGYWNGQARQCGPPYGFYNVGSRPTRTPKPQPATATGTPPTATRTRTSTPTPPVTITTTPIRTNTPFLTPTTTKTSTPTSTPVAPQSATPVPTAACQIAYISTDIPKQIPDPGTVISNLVVGGAGTISNIAVTGISIAHTYSSDLTAYLISPQGTRVGLFLHRCGNNVWTISNTGFTLTDSGGTLIGSTCPPAQGTYRPQEPLSPLVGQQAAGTWQLEVTDDGPSDTGTVEGWGLTITYGGTACATGTPAATSSPTYTRTNTPTRTPTRTATSSATTAPTNTAVGTSISTSTRTSTSVMASTTATRTSTGTRTSTQTSTSSATRSATATRTSAPGSTSTSTRTPTRTSTAIRTSTATKTSTSAPTNTQVVATPTSGTACQVTYASTNVPRAVPDQGTTTSTLAIGESGTIADIAVTGLTIAHTYSSDLRLFLTSPQGTRVELFSFRCANNVWTTSNTGFTLSNGASADMGAVCPPAQGSYRPLDSLAAFNGQSVTGTWTLEVTDAGPFDTGTLYGWNLQITYVPGTCPGRIPTPVEQVTPVPCTASFVDVPEGDTFYEYVQWMACQEYVSGYQCGSPGEPCPGSYFRPGASVTRGQLVKMVVNAAGGPFVNPESPTFADVPIDSAFYTYIETAAAHNIIGGYSCSGPSEPCDGVGRPYFRPGNNITRGQLSKVVALARRMDTGSSGSARFADVPLDNPFSGSIEAVASSGIVSGYPCGGPGEPCDAANRPYFRPGSTATRGQVSKIVTRGYEGP